jgi:hypothetical protein
VKLERYGDALLAVVESQPNGQPPR